MPWSSAPCVCKTAVNGSSLPLLPLLMRSECAFWICVPLSAMANISVFAALPWIFIKAFGMLLQTRLHVLHKPVRLAHGLNIERQSRVHIWFCIIIITKINGSTSFKHTIKQMEVINMKVWTFFSSQLQPFRSHIMNILLHFVKCICQNLYVELNSNAGWPEVVDIITSLFHNGVSHYYYSSWSIFRHTLLTYFWSLMSL